MDLNNLQANPGARSQAKRAGRGIGSGLGKTCGRGHKGQKSRSGGFHKIGFEGGQMPLQRRLPKFGFTSKVSLLSAQVRLSDLNKLEQTIVDLDVLKAAGLVKKSIKHVKIFLAGEITKALTIKGLKVSKGAKEAIEKAGGKIEE